MKTYQNLFNKDYPQIILLGGLPASGKSTLAKEFLQNNFFTVSKDDIRHNFACIKYGYQPETFFKGEQLHEFSPAVHFVIEMITYAYRYHVKGKNKETIENGIAIQLDKYYHRQGIQTTITQMAECIGTYVQDILSHNYKGIVFEATFTSVKQRSKVINTIHADMPVSCIFLDIPSDVAYKRNVQRSETITGYHEGKPVYGRYVPQNAIENMEITTALPTRKEGFKDIYILNQETVANNKRHIINIYKNFVPNDDVAEMVSEYFPSFKKTINFNQQNSHHKSTLDCHQMNVANHIKNNSKSISLFFASLLHDVGKVNTQTFYAKLNQDFEELKSDTCFKIAKKSKDTVTLQERFGYKTYTVPINAVDFDADAHYYNHQNISALIARRELITNGFSYHFANRVYFYILHHMDIPFAETIKDNHLFKLSRKFTKKELLNLALFREGDELASSGSVNTDTKTIREFFSK